jgi:membrane-bound serine protease (ClpP class)
VDRRLVRAFLAVSALCAILLAPSASASPAHPRVLAIHYATEVNPVTQDYLTHQLSRAQSDGYDAAVIVLDTPGGLSDSMRKIVQAELGLRIPVIVYVSPQGARAASAGVWISQAADLLAMAPETNIGSSTPIDSSGANISSSDLRRKVVNDAAASLRSLAKVHGRNAAWADAAVRHASNLTAAEALHRNVIDMVAPSLPALLRQADGFKTVPKGYVLHLAGAQIDQVSPGFFTRLLNVLIDPNLISLLFIAGLAGIAFEVLHPGVVLPGALGGVSLLLALFGFAVLPVSWTALALVVLGVALLIVDLHVASHGALTLAGLVALVLGLVTLFHNAPPPYQVSIPLVASIAGAIAAFWAFAMGKAVQARRRPVAVGPDQLVGVIGEARGHGLVFVSGELWQAQTPEGSEPRPGELVVVESRDGLVLTVRPTGRPAGVA